MKNGNIVPIHEVTDDRESIESMSPYDFGGRCLSGWQAFCEKGEKTGVKSG